MVCGTAPFRRRGRDDRRVLNSWTDNGDAESKDAEADLGLGRVRADNVLRGLEGSGVLCPQSDRALVFRYLDHCVKTGTLPAPAAREV
ncbi:hypothetical protein ACWGH3_31335 [Streptomyces sp. NPDC054884]|uniref:hypothetical protein n=1 Tax=Streptomyces sp. ME08-AFT2 TaxID=3028683 RepID=UPI0029AA47C9|nr:hypothetical protein [Streptomyces sp. ME08-AFT2]MDX3314115.1 hypothetical protein [Streptomyces sp. ME08-AFT2]